MSVYNMHLLKFRWLDQQCMDIITMNNLHTYIVLVPIRLSQQTRTVSFYQCWQYRVAKLSFFLALRENIIHSKITSQIIPFSNPLNLKRPLLIPWRPGRIKLFHPTYQFWHSTTRNYNNVMCPIPKDLLQQDSITQEQFGLEFIL